MAGDPLMKIFDEDEVDLYALRLVFREAEIRLRETCQADLDRSVQDAQDRAIDERAQRSAGMIAAQGCLRFDGQTEAPSEYRIAKHRLYSMYAMHPDTAAQVIEAVELLMQHFGPRVRLPKRAKTIAPKTVRNTHD